MIYRRNLIFNAVVVENRISLTDEEDDYLYWAVKNLATQILNKTLKKASGFIYYLPDDQGDPDFRYWYDERRNLLWVEYLY